MKSIVIKMEESKMYGFVSGISDTYDINYCPKCGSQTLSFHGDGTAVCSDCGYGTAVCSDCGFVFGVVECEEDE